MGIRPQFKLIRNIEIYKRRKAGESAMTLAQAYNLHLSRIPVIVAAVASKIKSGQLQLSS